MHQELNEKIYLSFTIASGDQSKVGELVQNFQVLDNNDVIWVVKPLGERQKIYGRLTTRQYKVTESLKCLDLHSRVFAANFWLSLFKKLPAFVDAER